MKFFCVLFLTVTAIFWAPLPAVADVSDLLGMSEQLDEIEQQDFLTAINKANACTQMHDFECTASQFEKAAKLASSARDRQTLAAARENMQDEQTKIAELARLRAEEEEHQRIAQAEQLERERQQATQASQAGGFQWGKAAALLGGSAIGGIGKLSSEVQVKVFESIIKDSMAGQKGIGNFKGTAGNLAAEHKAQQVIIAQQQRKQQANAMVAEADNNERLLKAAKESRQANVVPQDGDQQQMNDAKFAIAQSDAENSRAAESWTTVQTSRKEETWHDEYTNTVTKTGVTKSYPDHEKNIPASIVASRVGDRASAETVWAHQGGKVIDYQGSIASGRITVVVDFGYIVDNHVFVRDSD